MPEGPTQQRRANDLDIGAIYPQSSNVETLSGDKTLSSTDEQVQVLDPTGARDVILPEDEEGLMFWIVNDADGAEDITVEDSDNNTVDVVQQNESGLFYNHGGGWVVLVSASASGGQNV